MTLKGKARGKADWGNSELVRPVEDPEFWRWRIVNAFATGGMLHQAILDDSYDLWNYLQTRTAGILLRHVPPGAKLLDAGCGYGALLGCFEISKQPVDYVGVDISPDLIELARERYPGRSFEVGDLRKLRWPDKHFDWCVCRSVQGMIEENVGKDAWAMMAAEIRRVSRNVIWMGYPTRLEEPIPHQVERDIA